MTNSEQPQAEPAPQVRSGLGFKILILLATLVATVSMFAVWANRQMLNADNWTRTSSQMLGDTAIRSAISVYVTDKIYENINVEGQLQKAFPDQAQLLAGPAATALRGVAQDAIDKALGTPIVQGVWEGANRLAITQLINVVEENNVGALNFQGNDVKLDLRPAALNLAGKVGLQSQVQQIPAGSANVTVFSSGQIGQVRAVAKFLNGVAVIFPLLAVLLYGLAIGSSRGRRRRAVLAVGWSLIAASILTFVIRDVFKDPFVTSAAKTAAVRPAVTNAYDIATSMLGSIAGNTVIVAIVLILAATLAGPMSAATSIRKSLAPWLNGTPNLGYGVGFGLLALLVLWGPIPALRSWIALPIFAVMTGLGIRALEAQLVEEFPNAATGTHAQSLNALWARITSGVSSGVTRGGDAARQAAGQVRDRVSAGSDGKPDPPQAPSQHSSDGNGNGNGSGSQGLDAGHLERLERLGKLHSSGVLSDAEFEAEKQKLLGQR